MIILLSVFPTGSSRIESLSRIRFCLAAFATLVGSSGVEPPTSCLSGMRSNLLSYEPISFSAQVSVRSLRPHRGGDEGNRTLDPLLAGQVLSQLSYTPISGSLTVPENRTTTFLLKSFPRRLLVFCRVCGDISIAPFSLERR